MGRAKNNSLVIDDPRVSGRHAHIVRKANGWMLVDSDSSNGTFVNTKRVTEHVLEDGDAISFRECPIKCVYRTTAEAVAPRTQCVSTIQERFDPWAEVPSGGRNAIVPNRVGEHGPVPFRVGRFFNVNGQWYFSTRTGGDKGPYTSKDDAKAALVQFLRTQTT
jgi:hypothetical protein